MEGGLIVNKEELAEAVGTDRGGTIVGSPQLIKPMKAPASIKRAVGRNVGSLRVKLPGPVCTEATSGAEEARC